MFYRIGPIKYAEKFSTRSNGKIKSYILFILESLFDVSEPLLELRL